MIKQTLKRWDVCSALDNQLVQLLILSYPVSTTRKIMRRNAKLLN